MPMIVPLHISDKTMFLEETKSENPFVISNEQLTESYNTIQELTGSDTKKEPQSKSTVLRQVALIS